MADKIVKLNTEECAELSAWLSNQTNVEIEAGYREIIFRRGTAVELRMTLIEPEKSTGAIKAVKATAAA